MALLPALAWAGGGFIDEVRLGVLAHDVTLGGRHLEPGEDINGEILFVSPDFLSFLWSPRPNLGFDVNNSGNTDSFYGGLSWEVTAFRQIFLPADRLFFDLALGGAYQDGFVDNAPPGRKRLGSPVLFREGVDIGYGFTERISFSVLIDHISNANLGNHNAGITNVGGRMGLKF
jgi:lipid A 3-O-deacylase